MISPILRGGGRAIWRRTLSWLVLVGAVAWVAAAPVPRPDRVLPEGQVPRDVRLEPLKDLNGYFPFIPPTDLAAWQERSAIVRRQLQVSLGLWPWPTRTSLNAVVHGRVNREGYTVEKVYFESMPGFFVTGNLYRPEGQGGRRPAVLCPHGHWTNGRFLETSVEETQREIASGAERFAEGGRSVLQARCVQLARLGCVVFHYDMLGYADSVQIPMEIAHGFAKQRPEMNQPADWGLFSPQAESHAQSVMGLQTWNSIRALDFLCGLPDVDSGRIGVTGASGGGTQTFILCALDARPAAAFPAVMVSTAMQGGCTCENACGLRVETGNVEIAGLFAPKPLGMTAANDWTKDMPTKGFPELQRLYALLDAPDQVHLTPLLQYGHNYNAPSRSAMYHWLSRHLRLNLPEPLVEGDYQRLTRAELSVWDAAHPQPETGPAFERRLLRWWLNDAQRRIQESLVSPAAFRHLAQPALAAVIGDRSAAAPPPRWTALSKAHNGHGTRLTGLVRDEARGEETPVLALLPARPKGRVVIWLDRAGAQGLFEPGASGSGAVSEPVRELVAGGSIVMGADLFLQGSFLADGSPVRRTRRVENPREAAAYTFGYNRSVFAQRVHDVLRIIRWLESRPDALEVDRPFDKPEIALVALEGAGPWAAAARALVPERIRWAAIDTSAFRFGAVQDLHDPQFLPGGAKYGDLPGMLAVAAPGKLWLRGEGSRGSELAPLIRATYGASLASIQVDAGDAAGAAARAADWVGRQR